MRTGADSAEKMLRAGAGVSTSSLCASLSKCSVGSMPALESFCASVAGGRARTRQLRGAAGVRGQCGAAAAAEGPENVL